MLSIYNLGVTEQMCEDYCFGYTDADHVPIKGMLQWIKDRIQTALFANLSELKNRKDLADIKSIRSLLTDDKVKEIIKGKPERLLEIWTTDFKKYRDTKLKYKYNSKGKVLWKTVGVLYHIFNYDSFRSSSDKEQYRGFLLAKNLGIECCPYCNRNYTTTHVTFKGKTVFPEFDHFYHKSVYPIFAVSFYNLIPSCNICNTHYKGSKDVILENLLHPYSDIMINHFNFKFIPQSIESLYGKDDKFELDFAFNCDNPVKDKVEKSIAFFGIKENYEKTHSNLIKEIVNKKLTYSNKYLQIIKDTYGISFEESYRILFETYYEDDKLHQRPFSKLKKDIFDDINIG